MLPVFPQVECYWYRIKWTIISHFEVGWVMGTPSWYHVSVWHRGWIIIFRRMGEYTSYIFGSIKLYSRRFMQYLLVPIIIVVFWAVEFVGLLKLSNQWYWDIYTKRHANGWFCWIVARFIIRESVCEWIAYKY